MFGLHTRLRLGIGFRKAGHLALCASFACAHRSVGASASAPQRSEESVVDSALDTPLGTSRLPSTPGAELQGAPAEQPEEAGSAESTADPAGAPVITGAVTSATSTSAVQVMMDIEARLAIEVRDVTSAVSEVRSIVAATGGQIMQESLQDARPQRPTANLTVRIPSQGAFDFLARLESTGVVRSRNLNSRDVGKEYYDASLRVRSLERVLERYQELLAKAGSIDETLKIEEHIARVSGEIERIKGELRWLKDRVARATVHLEIFAKGDWVEPVVTPEAKLYPGLRAAGSIDWRGDSGSQYGVGAGVSLRFSRHFSVDFDGFQNTESPRGDLDLALLTLGGEFYSDFLGAGRRRWFNPYLGLRGGYARIEGHNQFVVGGTLGIEIFKTDPFTLSLDTRFFEAFGGDLGNHLVVVPALGTNFAF